MRLQQRPARFFTGARCGAPVKRGGAKARKGKNDAVKKLFCLTCMVLTLCILSGCAKEEAMLSQTRFMLDTFVTLYLYPENQELFTPCFELAQSLEKKLSAHYENGEIYSLNKNKSAKVSAETLEVIKKGVYYGKLSRGKFDISILPLRQTLEF